MEKAKNKKNVFLNLTKKLLPKTLKFRIIFGCVVLLVIVLLVRATSISLKVAFSKPNVAVMATLQNMVDKRDLSTMTTPYQGIVEVKDKKDPQKTDYFVSYKAEIKAGINISEVDISSDMISKTVRIHIPDARITDVIVDIKSLDYMFYDKKSDDFNVSGEAYDLCTKDVDKAIEEQEAIIQFAKENAKAVLETLAKPIVEQHYKNYTLIVE